MSLYIILFWLNNGRTLKPHVLIIAKYTHVIICYKVKLFKTVIQSLMLVLLIFKTKYFVNQSTL